MLCRAASAERQALGGRAAFGEGGSAAGWGHWDQKALTARPAGRSGELPEDKGGENGAQMEGRTLPRGPSMPAFFFFSFFNHQG